MRATKRAFFIRSGAACAAAAVLIGGTFAASTATAAPSTNTAPSSIATAIPSAPTTQLPAETTLPDGLAEAIRRDLGKSIEEFNADGTVAAKAADVQASLTAADPSAVVSVEGDTINVKTSDPGAAKTAAGNSKAKVSTPQAPPLVAKQHSDLATVLADYAEKFGVTNLQSIMTDGNGNVVIRTGDAITDSPAPTSRTFMASTEYSTDDFASNYANVVIESAPGPVAAFATDVTNGQGYLALAGKSVFACSIGWNGFDAAGKAAVISAGHCAEDGTATETALSNPATEPAVGGQGGGFTAVLGTFGASQFGGPNNSPVTGDVNGPASGLGNIGTDVSVIDGINPDLNQLAKVTDWTTPDTPKSSGPVVTGVSTAVVGTDVCKSGRTTGWSCSKVDEVGYFFVAGKNYPADSAACDPVATVPECNDIRGVRGFGSKALVADRGDSGGAIIAGSLAVGMVSAGIPGVISYGVDLKDALAHTEGYTVKISLETPKVTTSAPVYRQGAVTGTLAGAPAGTTVSVTIDGKTTDAAVGQGATWSVDAPNKFGTFDVTAQARNGFSTSEITKASVTVIKETLAAPAITSPADGSSVAAPVTTITGNGKPGATVELSGDVTGTVKVGGDGKWSFTLPSALDGLGWYTVTAKQILADWNDSVKTTSDFTVAPDAPAVTSPTNGQAFLFNEGPSVISGTNMEDARVQVTMNGKQYNAVVEGTTWSVTLDAPLNAGNYAITTVQQWGDFQSLTGTYAFVVNAEPQPEPTTPPATQEPTTAATAAPAPAANNDLASTGASGSTMLLGVAGGLLVLGGAAFMIFRRRSSK
ncbi:LPXTG-motif cell wall anchor domain-containing protein [Arthrobacter alpinus]|uniref:LPXTG-motif cell wall anchor domain-containing protein n=1 Tax=Arthrobacter alpinus TaxID=656366 RepID=A0A1H5MJM9_9MICC|nr:S1 family peptidase [Arthrobacter alpinus]SEE89605.1 LPXTG-motif cell wall anchor domain-containing protein [Arthrobacter alpinus]